MFVRCELIILILALTLDGRVHTGEIIGGHQAAPHSRPYMVLLERHMQDNETRHCGGFLLNEDFVMTAAHCQASSYFVLLGVHNIKHNAGRQRIPVETAYPHENYGTNYENDIMLLKLSSKANISENVRPIALADQDDGSLPKSCIVCGWGRTNRSINLISPVLMEANVTLIKDDVCDEEKSYCSEGLIGPGRGDSGGPLVCEDEKAYGVVSSSGEYSDGSIICTYTKISVYRNWTNSIMGPHGNL